MQSQKFYIFLVIAPWIGLSFGYASAEGASIKSLPLFSLYSTFLEDDQRNALHIGKSCSEIEETFQSPQKRIDTLAYKILFNTLPGDIKTAVDDDKSTSLIATTKNISRSNLSLNYYRITHLSELSGMNETDIYRGYTTWLREIYGGKPISFEGTAIDRFLSTNPDKNGTIEDYLEKVVEKNDNEKASDPHTKLLNACITIEESKMTHVERFFGIIKGLLGSKENQSTLKIYGTSSGTIVVIILGFLFIKRTREKNRELREQSLRYTSVFKGEQKDIPQKARELMLMDKLSSLKGGRTGKKDQ